MSGSVRRWGSRKTRLAEAYLYAIRLGVIVGFRHKGLKLLYETGSTRGVQAAHAPKLLRMLDVLDRAETPADLDIPGYRTHPLKGSLQGFWAVWVSGNWRMTFRFAGTDIELVDYQDYH